MSTLSGFYGGGGGVGTLFSGPVTQVTFTANTTITCPVGKHLKIHALYQIIANTTGSQRIELDLSFGSRTIATGLVLDDYSPFLQNGAFGQWGIGYGGDTRNIINFMIGKENENIVITNFFRPDTSGGQAGYLTYEVLES